MKDLGELSAYDFPLDRELIAQFPVSPRDHSRLLVVDRKKQSLQECPFYKITDYINDRDLMVYNQTKVIPARLSVSKERRASFLSFKDLLIVESLNLEDKREYGLLPELETWFALLKGSGRLKKGQILHIYDQKNCPTSFTCEIAGHDKHGRVIVQFPFAHTEFLRLLELCGHIPLPPYIRGGRDCKSDRRDYQSIFAQDEGSVAAPTASLHFTPSLLSSLECERVSVTLHVGMGTFSPVRSENLDEHHMHREYYELPASSADKIYRAKSAGKRILALGTTVCRCLETMDSIPVQGVHGYSELFIRPGFHFKHVDRLLTNFHLPRSTLLMLVAAFAGYDLMMEAYQYAQKHKFRFFSYGDAMLIL